MTGSRSLAAPKMTFGRVMAGEWLKLRKQRSFVWSTLWAFALAVGLSALAGALLRDEWANNPAEALGLTTTMPASGIYVAALLFGAGICVWLTGEFVSGSNTLTLMVVPKRRTVFLARLALVGLLGVGLGGLVALSGTGLTTMFVGMDRTVMALRESTFLASIVVAPIVGLSITLFYFAAATLTRRSLPAVGLIAAVFFVLPSVQAYVSFLGGPALISRALDLLPGSLLSDALTIVGAGAEPSFSYQAASLLLLLWSLVSVSAAAWSFSRHE